jgi:rhamnulokinase
MEKFLAIDLGAESGRGIIGTLNKDKIEISIIHRFPTHRIFIHNHLFWNAPQIFNEIKHIISMVKHEKISGIGITTWGVDYGLIDKNGILLSLPFSYRDNRTENIMEEVFQTVPKEEIFTSTGIQFMPVNTLFQIYATKKECPWMLENAQHLLFMPDLYNFWLTDKIFNEFTIASTSQMYNMTEKENLFKNNWARHILNKMEIPTHFLGEIAQPATLLGHLTDYIQKETGAGPIPVWNICSHDTASAVFAIPAEENSWAYLSSGTWSLLGIERKNPIINKKSLEMNFTNEGGYNGIIRFLKNIMGLWILQECRKEWKQKGFDYDYIQLAELARKAKPFFAFININSPEFIFPGEMAEKVINFCKDTGQEIPSDIGQITRIILEGLAFEYRYNLENIESIIGEKIEALHIVGGGAQNKLLSEFSASATNKQIVCGPVEATAIGNIGVQMIGSGIISSWQEFRKRVQNSFPLEIYSPKDTSLWENNYRKYLKIKKQSSQTI